MKVIITSLFLIIILVRESSATIINFDDTSGSFTDITTRYTGLGVTFNTIDNHYGTYITGPFPTPANLPAILGGVTTWSEGFSSATSPRQVAVSAPTTTIGSYGDGGILISFAFDVSYVSLVGNDLGTGNGTDDESVTLSAYNADGVLIGQVYSQINLAGPYDQTPAAIELPNIRYVAFNYTDSLYGFYAIDDLQFTAVPEPATASLFGLITVAVIAHRKRKAFKY